MKNCDIALYGLGVMGSSLANSWRQTGIWGYPMGHLGRCIGSEIRQRAAFV